MAKNKKAADADTAPEWLTCSGYELAVNPDGVKRDGLERGAIALRFILKTMGCEAQREVAWGDLDELGELLQIVDDVLDYEDDVAAVRDRVAALNAKLQRTDRDVSEPALTLLQDQVYRDFAGSLHRLHRRRRRGPFRRRSPTGTRRRGCLSISQCPLPRSRPLRLLRCPGN